MVQQILNILHGDLSLESLQQFATLSSWAMIIVGAMTLIATLFITAPYGKFSKEKGWGFRLPSTMSWMIMESPNLWMPFMILSLFPIKLTMQSKVPLTALSSPLYVLEEPEHFWGNPNFVLLVMFLLHYIHRDIIFPQFLSASNPMPVSVMLLAFLFCSWNATNQALTLFFAADYNVEEWWNASSTKIGIALFFIGMGINVFTDYSLIAQKSAAQELGIQYIIPQGFLFDLVACPNYSTFIQLAS